MGYFAVLDTETNWGDQVMSIGAVVADSETFSVLDSRYYILAPEYQVGGMYTGALVLRGDPNPVVCGRREAMEDLCRWLRLCGASAVYAYNAAFDRKHLPELSAFVWYDIMRVAAYRQLNPCIPSCAECCSTGRLKRNYGVEPMLRLLSGNRAYHETHNALHDARDELEIMRLLGRAPEAYIPL